MMKRVVFFNHWHNGDIHASRGIVNKIIEKVGLIKPATEFIYSHKNAPSLLIDIPKLSYDASLINNIDPQIGSIIIGDTAYINTWYDQERQKHARKCGILTFDALYSALDESCIKLWDFSLSDISANPIDFFPTINYEKFYIEKAKSWLSNSQSKKILIENGKANSNQSHNFSFYSIIDRLSKEYPNVTFILSSKNDFPFTSNVFYTSDIIGKSDTDLNEVSFLSTRCDIIIGRASGVFTFTLTKQNLFERNIKYLCFSHLTSFQTPFWLGKLFSSKLQYTSSIINNATANAEEAYHIIKGYL